MSGVGGMGREVPASGVSVVMRGRTRGSLFMGSESSGLSAILQELKRNDLSGEGVEVVREEERFCIRRFCKFCCAFI